MMKQNLFENYSKSQIKAFKKRAAEVSAVNNKTAYDKAVNASTWDQTKVMEAYERMQNNKKGWR